MEKEALIVNIFGGPGCGKSTTAAGVFHILKMRCVDCELVTEYAKDVVWEEAFKKLDNQLYVFAKQHNRVFRCLDKVDVIVTDSPANLGLIYGDLYTETMSNQLRALIKHEFAARDNLNIVLNRKKKYNANGRMQTEDEAREIDDAILHILNDANQDYQFVNGDELAPAIIADKIFKRLEAK